MSQPTGLNTGEALKGLALGLVIGLIAMTVIGAVAGAGGYLYVKRKAREARAGWNLVPVVVAAEPITAGTVLTYDMIAQRPIPEQFVTSSVVKPDSANYIVDQRINVSVQPGDALLWSQFEVSKSAAASCDLVEQLKARVASAQRSCDAARAQAKAAQVMPTSTRPAPGAATR